MPIGGRLAVLGLLAVSFLLFGCVEQLFPGEISGATDVARAMPEIQSFLKAHPDARITTTYWTKSAVSADLESIQKVCGPQFSAGNYYKVVFESSEASVLAWVDLKEKIVVCSIIQGKGAQATPITQPVVTSVPFATPTPGPEESELPPGPPGEEEVPLVNSSTSGGEVPSVNISPG
jgi:hypothetical protein